MMNELYAAFLLSFHVLQSREHYEALLHERFLNEADSDILLELEECSWSLHDTNTRFLLYWRYDGGIFVPDTFGRALFAGLKEVYDSSVLPIKEFGHRAYALWNTFPESIAYDQPFWTLSHADECLSWGDEAQTRKMYEEAFAFYGFDTEEIDGH